MLSPPMGAPHPGVPYPSILVEDLHHHSGGLIPDTPGVPIQQHPVKKQRLVPEGVQGAGQHPGALADVREGDVGDGVWGDSGTVSTLGCPIRVGDRGWGTGLSPTCGGLGAAGCQLQRLEDVAAELEEVGLCRRGRGWQGALAPPASPRPPPCPPGLTLEGAEDEGHGLLRGGPG